MIIKQCQFSGRDDSGVHVHLLHPGYDNEHLVKVAAASPPQLERVLKLVRSMPKTNSSLPVLVSAMGAGEYWGSNSNGDYFPESSLIHTPPNWLGLSLDLQRQLGARWEWGYPTFYNAHAFQHHVNKDPARAFGDVVYAMWDPQMKRVLLVINIDREKARVMGAISVVDKIENGEFPDVSMGCKVPYDVCTICADWSRITQNPKKDLAEHRKRPIRGLSTTRHEYCQHLQAELNKIYPDGRKVAMINLHPKFFDLSFVFIGADKTSKVMAKLAGAQMCPIRSNARMCKKGCFDCAIPSSHVYEVWSREKTAERAERSGAVAVSMSKEEPTAYDRMRAEATSRGLTPHQHAMKMGRKEWLTRINKARKEDAASGRPWLGDKKIEKKAVTFPGMERELRDERDEMGPLEELFGIDKQSAAEIAKKAEIIKQIRSNFSKSLPGMTAEEPNIPNDVLNAMSQCPREALGTAGSMGIVLKPREFQRTIIIARGRPDLADQLDDAGACFSPGAPPSRDFSISDKIIPRLLQALAPLIGERSCFGPPVHRRVIRMTIIKRPESPLELEGNPLLDKLSADYSAYRQQLLYKQAALVDQLIHEHPWVTSAILGPQIEGSFGGGLVKAGGSVVESMLGMLSIDYLNQAHLPKPISEFVSDHCDLAGLKSAGELASCGRVA